MGEVHLILNQLVEVAIVFFEFMGVIVLIFSGIRGMFEYITKKQLTRLNLAKGMAMGLEFKLGSEILRTVVVRDLTEILTVAGIILLRATLTFLIHWEIKNEEEHNKAHELIESERDASDDVTVIHEVKHI